jgi:hypothetical protein
VKFFTSRAKRQAGFWKMIGGGTGQFSKICHHQVIFARQNLGLP